MMDDFDTDAYIVPYHIACIGTTDNGTWEKVMGFARSIAPSQVIRVHSGNGPLSALQAIDQHGANVHLVTRRDAYVWNNDRGDCSALWQVGEREHFDKACYPPNPPEGVTLQRVGDRLVAPAAAWAGAGARR